MTTILHYSTKRICLLIIWVIIPVLTYGQNVHEEVVEGFPMSVNDAKNPCITTEQYDSIEQECNRNAITFSWPLKQANGLTDCSNYVITNNVDVDNTSGIKDYTCGSRTYNGHRGTDIVPEPYPFYKMDNNQVEVIAALGGTIVAKTEGNFDKNCVTGANPFQGNHIAIQHSDGSRTLYYHMKKNSLTSKIIGQTVVTGEFLGIVGSSGSSNIPHLHFEVWSGSSSTTLNDPYAGTCNLFNATSWWINQKPYKEPGIIKLQINTIPVVLTSCPTTETPNELSNFAPTGGTARFYRWIRDDSPGLVSTMRIINPDGTTFDTWEGISNTSFNLALYNSTRTLPTVPGIYTYEAVNSGIICTKTFTINCPDNINLVSPTDDQIGTTNTQKAGMTITATNKINTGASVGYQAVNSIILNAGAEIMNVKTFKAEIKGCEN
jgi:murein DD-endopeptidase MepM/ murein hydrolase activator NlpD